MSNAAVDRHLSEAMRARRAGREFEARQHFEAVLTIDPDQPFARNALGMSALTHGDAVTAAEHFEAATRGDPSAEALWMNLAKAKRMLGDAEGEKAALEGALSTDQTHIMARIRFAELCERTGDNAGALEHWRAVRAAASHLPDAPPQLQERFAHAKQFIEKHTRAYAAAMEQGLSNVLASASARDRRRATAAAQRMLGRRTIYQNICHGLHYPFLPADEYFDREHFPWLQELEAQTDLIRAELLALLKSPDPGLAPYVEMPKGTPENKWTALDNSLDWSSLHLWKEGERIDEACARAPNTAAFVETLPLARIPNRAPTVFFSILKAGKHIPPHTGVTNVRAIVHLPLIVPGDCEFRVGGDTRVWVEGQAFVFDDTIEHEAWNRSDKDRAVLILDCWNPHLSTDEQVMISRMFEIADDQKSG